MFFLKKRNEKMQNGLKIEKEKSVMQPKLFIGLSSVIGNRDSQQDKGLFWKKEQRIAAVVCDGMGGLAGGELASKRAATCFLKDVEQVDWEKEFPDFFKREMNCLDEQVVALKDKEGKRLKAGTTLVAVLVDKDKFWYVSVGDSRLYFFHDGELMQITTDHTYELLLKEYMEKNYISKEEYEEGCRGRKAQTLISYLGMGKEKKVDYSMGVLQQGDKLILCSDGLYKTLYEEQIKGIVAEENEAAQKTAERLTQVAERCSVGNQDNTTAIVIEYR